MTRAQAISLTVFFSILSAAIALAVCWDIYLAETGPDGATTESWSLAVLGRARPFVVYILGLLSGLPIMIGIHIYGGMDSPDDWTELVNSRWIIATLRAKGTTIPDVPDNLDYN